MLLIIFTLIQFSYNSCININTDIITNYLNMSYNKECYDYTIQNNKDCCNNFLVDNECQNMYEHCNNYNDYVIGGIHDVCQSHNQTISNISYSDYCHKFILNIEPYCCENISTCINWYTNCVTNFSQTITNCSIPTKYTSETCTNYTLNIDSNCCDYFNDHCHQIYDYCIKTSPESVSVFDLFLPPQVGYIIGTTLTTYTDIPSLHNCLQMCLSNLACLSINYNEKLHYCHLTRHVVDDHINKQIVHLNDNTEYIYYEKKFTMPHTDTYCNVRFPTYIGDSVCDKVGGYNTDECFYDGGDCCRQSCLQNSFNLLCGLGDYMCIDPKYNPTSSPTPIPTIIPTIIPTLSPTQLPTLNPTQLPTKLIRNIISESTKDRENKSGIITVLTVLLILMSILFVGYVVRDKYSNKVQINPGGTMHFSNPVYDSNKSPVHEEENEVYQDVNLDDDDDNYDDASNYMDDDNYQLETHEENNFMN